MGTVIFFFFLVTAYKIPVFKVKFSVQNVVGCRSLICTVR
jgi:hypothetical protein